MYAGETENILLCYSPAHFLLLKKNTNEFFNKTLFRQNLRL
jgi:hypothetical protein